MLPPNRLFSVFRTAARGMEAQRLALGAAAENVANATTTRTEDGTPYAVKRTVQEALGDREMRFGRLLDRMQTALRTSDPRHADTLSLRRSLPEIEMGPMAEVEEREQLRYEFDPAHPHADADGYVAYPDVNVVEEMGHMMSANRIYEANLTAVQAAKEMYKRTLEI
ncbi:MAG: flagellar basal body rod protein FlgC [Rhodothermales bacterium]|nr:flagellar basal body rod protein FlgC [Rhodothermales bacterium]